jgi:hypothetical protein
MSYTLRILLEPNKQFEKSIGSIISGLGHLGLSLVITMREEIYQKFNPIGKEHLDKYIRKLNIANRSYDPNRRKDMLCRWATVMNCKWFQDENLREEVLDYIAYDETKLPTPLNIKDFASETAAAGNGFDKSFDKQKLFEIINRKSTSTPLWFARDIEEMHRHGEIDKILFLCFPFISDWFPFDFFKAEYNELCKNFKIKDAYAFERACAKFHDKQD